MGGAQQGIAGKAELWSAESQTLKAEQTAVGLEPRDKSQVTGTNIMFAALTSCHAQCQVLYTHYLIYLNNLAKYPHFTDGMLGSWEVTEEDSVTPLLYTTRHCLDRISVSRCPSHVTLPPCPNIFNFLRACWFLGRGKGYGQSEFTEEPGGGSGPISISCFRCA